MKHIPPTMPNFTDLRKKYWEAVNTAKNATPPQPTPRIGKKGEVLP